MRVRPRSPLTHLAVLGALVLSMGSAAATWLTRRATSSVDDGYAEHIRPVLAARCFACHGPDKQKGDLRLDALDPDFVQGSDAEAWHVALDMIEGGDMPPPRADPLSDDERRAVVAWIRAGLTEAARAREGEARPVLRRLNREQYANTLRDLLGIEMDFGRSLPSDGKSKAGFTNNGAVLLASPLHLDGYQDIARAALDDALGGGLAGGPRPAATHYRVRFGEGIGRGHVAASTGGYQSVPLPTEDFVIDVLDAEGRPLVDLPDDEAARLDALRRKISVGLRGSSQDRFRVVPEGLMLYGALPHKEEAPGAWQGPSPNVKLELQRVFAERGDVVMRVRASRGYLWRTQEPLLVSLGAAAPRVTLDEATLALRTEPGALVATALASGERKNLRHGEAERGADLLVPEDVTKPSDAKLTLAIPADGFYQVDLVHPPVARDAMPSVRLSFRKLTLDLRPELSEAQLASERTVTAVGAAYLPAGSRDLRVGGPFFTGFSHLVLTPLPNDHELVRRLLDATAEVHAAREAALASRQPVLRAFAGTRTDDGMDYATFDRPAVVAAPLGAAETYEFHGRLEDLPIPEPESGDKEILSGFLLLGVWNHHLVKRAADTGPPLLIESIEVEAPYHPTWPPASHTRIFPPSPNAPTAAGGGDEEAYTREVLGGFMARAFRRPVDAREVDRYLSFWRDVRPEYDRYEASVREALVGVLCSPHFIFLVEPEPEGDEAAPLTEEALATRLAYFLWNSPPDAELADLAAAGELRSQLGAQVARMLDDPRSERFVRAFTFEWLRLDRLDTMTIDVDRFPDFTRFVKRDMREETLQFVAHVLREDLDLFTLIDSDFALLNQNLAEFYGVENVAGPEFRAVPLDRARGRGGLLSQGAFLAGHSNGSEPHPIKRAVWVKHKILGDAPPPPPPNVPELDPEAPGFEGLTLKEQLERHRDNASCRDCHAGIDPYGIAFERYDAVGRYHTLRQGKPVDDRTTLPDGTEIEGVAGLKRYILEGVPEAFTASLIEHLFGYALGRDVTFADEPVLAGIREHVESQGHHVRSVIEGIVLSPAFQH